MPAPQLDPEHLRDVSTLDDVVEYLSDELDWPIAAADLEEATFDWDPTELGIPPEQVPTLVSLRQLRPLDADQPWGIFFLEFDGQRLPLTPLRRLLDKLVTKKRSTTGHLKTWHLDDLLFIITTSTGDAVELHFVAVFDATGHPGEFRSIPWRPHQSPIQHLRRVATELLPLLIWPDDPKDVKGWRSRWRAAFPLRHGEAIATVNRLVERMATTAVDLRSTIATAFAAEAGSGPLHDLLDEIRTQLVATVTPAEFADMCAQTLVYGTLTARVTDPETFGASPTLTTVPLANPFLAAFFEEVHDHVIQLQAEGDGLEQLVADLKASNVEAILDQFGSTARGGDPVIHFYEEFLHRYDAELKIQAGAFYTPQAAVRFMVRMCDQVLRSRLGLPLGVADPTTWGELAERLGLDLPGVIDPDAPLVSMLDPATGTGTFIVEWLRRARANFVKDHGEAAWADHARATVLPGVHALELMLAPYAVAHLKTALELHEDGIDGAELGIYLTDTLARSGSGQLTFEPDAISVEGERANDVKMNLRATVCVGNPPYDRVAKDAGGGWITDNSAGRSLFDDILDPAREHTIFSHHASLYNKFVYFWRWCLWKTFEDRPGLPGVVTLIAPSSWLTGPGFLGLRQLVRQHADEVWVVDLGGDNRGTRKDENIFEIETPVAIVTVARHGAGDASTPAKVHYQHIEGSAVEKLRLLGTSACDLDDGWAAAPSGWFEPFDPGSGSADWVAFPQLIDLLPFQQPGCKFGRTWPIAPDGATLTERWRRLVATDDSSDRAVCFVTAKTGRNIYTKVAGRPTIAEEPLGAPAPPIVRYGFRSFDRQWAFQDPRVTALERPALWASLSNSQVFMTTMPTNALGGGLAASVSAPIPDLHYFCGRGGKDVIPLYRDAAGTPNADPAALEAICSAHRVADESAAPVTIERLFAYAYAVLAGGDYTDRFHEELQTPGPRVPLTAEPSLFEEAAAFGRRLLWLHTYGERFGEDFAGETLRHPVIELLDEITTLPAKPGDPRYDPDTQTLTVADGAVGGVSPEVWAFEVSGMPVVKKWLGYRAAKAAGKAASSSSPLDHIRPTAWPAEWTEELLDLLSVLQRSVDLRPVGAELLDRICDGPLIAAADLPPVPPELREPPAVTGMAVQGGLGI